MSYLDDLLDQFVFDHPQSLCLQALLSFDLFDRLCITEHFVKNILIELVLLHFFDTVDLFQTAVVPTGHAAISSL